MLPTTEIHISDHAVERWRQRIGEYDEVLVAKLIRQHKKVGKKIKRKIDAWQRIINITHGYNPAEGLLIAGKNPTVIFACRYLREGERAICMIVTVFNYDKILSDLKEYAKLPRHDW